MPHVKGRRVHVPKPRKAGGAPAATPAASRAAPASATSVVADRDQDAAPQADEHERSAGARSPAALLKSDPPAHAAAGGARPGASPAAAFFAARKPGAAARAAIRENAPPETAARGAGWPIVVDALGMTLQEILAEPALRAALKDAAATNGKPGILSAAEARGFLRAFPFQDAGWRLGPPRPTTTAPWYQTAVFYQVYPRSFQDSDGDGIGDLNGITARLGELQKLGVTALWLNPFFPSPQVDFGYDVSDFTGVDEQFGTVADFERLIEAAHARDIKVIIDFVPNHTSDEHPFFKSARASKDSPYRDFYIWHDPVDGGPPNNWESAFGPVAWTLSPETGQYYYHQFYPEQPDLNWRNPEVEEAVFGWVREWLDRGVDGLRLDAVNHLFEDAQLRDNPVIGEVQKSKHTRDQPEVHDVLKRLREVVREYGDDRVLVSENYVDNMDELVKYYGNGDDEVQLPFNFFLAGVPKLDAAAFRDVVETSEQALAGRWTTNVLSNHDMTRAISRFGDGEHDDDIAKVLAMMLLTLRGTPFLYYGEELGMVNTDPTRIEDVRDPVGIRQWPRMGRDGERTPMQWSGDDNAGFSPGKPWLPIPASAKTRNVDVERQDPASVYAFFQSALRVRKELPALLTGDYASIGDDPDVFAYRRQAERQTAIVALNMSAVPKVVRLGSGTADVVLSSASTRDAKESVSLKSVTLAPYEGLLLEVAGKRG